MWHPLYNVQHTTYNVQCTMSFVMKQLILHFLQNNTTQVAAATCCTIYWMHLAEWMLNVWVWWCSWCAEFILQWYGTIALIIWIDFQPTQNIWHLDDEQTYEDNALTAVTSRRVLLLRILIYDYINHKHKLSYIDVVISIQKKKLLRINLHLPSNLQEEGKN